MASTSFVAAAAEPEKSQYHHFIPRFILCNFVNPQEPSSSQTNMPGKKGKRRQTRKTRAFSGPTVNLLDLDEGKLKQAPLSRTFGLEDLYRDFDSSQPDQHRLEKQLSKLESRAAQIIANVKKAFEAGVGEVQMKRCERDLLRKFLFIMMYRNRTFHKRFNLPTEEYNSNDREQFLAYMKEKNFAHPIDVWFANIQAFLDVEMDVEQKWLQKISTQAYRPDAMWYYKHMQMSFLSFCTPEASDVEFLLTQNAYSIFEGPNDAFCWTDYHSFAPVSPKLMIVLRSNLLQNGESGGSETKLQVLNLMKSMHSKPEEANSYLDDLPVTLARNNYSRIVNGKLEAIPNKLRPENHVFYFSFFPISTAHVLKISNIMLEEALGTMAIVYRSPEALRSSLEEYLRIDTGGFKWEVGIERHATSISWSINGRRQYLKLLEAIARELGSNVILNMRHSTLDPC